MTDESRSDEGSTGDDGPTLVSDADGAPPSQRTVTAVASLRGVPVEDLPSLASVVDPDALDALFAPAHDGTPRDERGRVSFEYADCEVVVRANGRVEVRAVDDL